MPQLWQVGDTCRIACLSLKKATTYSRDAKVDARDKDKTWPPTTLDKYPK